MAEGYDFDNPTFDKDDYDNDYARDESYEDEDLNDLTPDLEFQRHILNQSTHLENLIGSDKEQALLAQQKLLVKEFYKEIQQRYDIEASYMPTYDNFKLDADGKTLYWVIGDKEIRLTVKQGSTTFRSLGSLVNEYNRIIGPGGTLAIRQYLNLPEYKSKSKPISQQVRNDLESIRLDLSTSNIAPHDISNETELNDLTNTVGDVNTAVKTLETSFIEKVTSFQQTQTTIDKREMDGIVKAMTTVNEELANELAKLTETNKEIAKEKQKLEQASGDDDDVQTKRITNRITDLEAERSARLEVININKEKLRSQVNRIKATIHKILNEDTTLGEKLRTLFREQGITIVSVLTAVGMIIGLLVETVIPSGAGSSTTPPSKPTSGGVKEWIKKQLSNIGKLLANLAGKAAAALPGIIGSIVSWILSTASKVADWFGGHLWAIGVVVAGLLYAAAEKYINKS